MKEEYDFSQGKRGAIDPTPAGKARITIRPDELLFYFCNIPGCVSPSLLISFTRIIHRIMWYSMVIATWNCNMAFRKKLFTLSRYNPDLMIIPECEHPEKLRSGQLDVPDQVIWIGKNNNKGLGVFSRGNLNISVHESYDPTIEYAIPITVTDKTSLTLIAIWAMDNKTDHKARYIGRVWQAVKCYAHLIKDNTFIIGDFNWNVIWDRSKKPLYGNLTQVTNELSSMEIVSFYHSYYGEHFGKETQPTLYLHRDTDKPYHVDYIFGPNSYLYQLQSLIVGHYSDWLQYSDHMPIIIDIQ